MKPAMKEALKNMKSYCREHAAKRHLAKKSAPKVDAKAAIGKAVESKEPESEHEIDEDEEDELPSVTIAVGSRRAPPPSKKIPVGKKK